eukprot:CAMPEP_0194765740 /NCGR_PEP_ID=MMETSP0323_2-20130528/27162_1 /TAXON_ID=2866 ORGANISM="Crypthecodinium cohnii, Strain Seligo" /NCGR_SAMPLE_ID=MMETSP0323_2 /ASSEMBLY_ACC=CAM_ASM_000346 /LENGTH=117 /DNA_ID=CAMNT_0039695817 /DNA_START=22 /DNA_END=371 /DNA_ORIENTATION=+
MTHNHPAISADNAGGDANNNNNNNNNSNNNNNNNIPRKAPPKKRKKKDTRRQEIPVHPTVRVDRAKTREREGLLKTAHAHAQESVQTHRSVCADRQVMYARTYAQGCAGRQVMYERT